MSRVGVKRGAYFRICYSLFDIRFAATSIYAIAVAYQAADLRVC